MAASLAGCASTADTSPVSAQMDLTRLDAYDIADLLPTTEEVGQRLGWTDNVNYETPDFNAALPSVGDGEKLVDAYGGALAIGVDCADTLKELGVLPGFPAGAVDAAGNMWAERDVTVRELWLARYPSAEAASAQLTGLPEVIEACPLVNAVGGGRTLMVIPSGLDGAVTLRASDSYSFVVAAFGSYLAQVEVGTSDEELASARVDS